MHLELPLHPLHAQPHRGRVGPRGAVGTVPVFSQYCHAGSELFREDTHAHLRYRCHRVVRCVNLVTTSVSKAALHVAAWRVDLTRRARNPGSHGNQLPYTIDCGNFTRLATLSSRGCVLRPKHHACRHATWLA